MRRAKVFAQKHCLSLKFGRLNSAILVTHTPVHQQENDDPQFTTTTVRIPSIIRIAKTTNCLLAALPDKYREQTISN